MNVWLKRLGYVVACLVGFIGLAAAGVYGASEARFRKEYKIDERPLAIRDDSASIARGEHLARSIGGCTECHGAQLQGAMVIDDPAFARIYARNLTRGKGGVGGTLTDADYERAIRHGVGANGRALKVMPSEDYVSMSDQDLAAVIAYVKSVPPVDNEVPPVSVGPVARALIVAGQLPALHAETIDHGRPSIPAVTPTVTVGYGAYLTNIGCKGCHGPQLAGGRIASGPPDWPPAANLTNAGRSKDWSAEDFKRVLREGKKPDGFQVNELMPWKAYKNLTDDEITAIWMYLRSLPAVQTPVSK